MNKIIELNGISKKYAYLKIADNNVKNDFKDFWALKEVSFEAGAGEILGIIGRNGAGKTTVLNIIAGVLSPTQGKVSVDGRVLGLFNLGVGFQDELTGRENIFLNGAILGASEKELNEKLQNIIDFSELGEFINMPMGSYSQGMRLRLGFSVIANLDFDILVVDEVLAVGDALFQDKCFRRLMDFKRMGKTLVISSQSMELIERLCGKVVLLEHGKLKFYGEVSEGINRYRALLNTEKFFVGPAGKGTRLITNTKKWADDVSMWGKELGTKEVAIESVEFINKFGKRCDNIKSGSRLKIKVRFNAKNKIKEPHFGVAIFREDGVYCYGPNTLFDGIGIREVNPGTGSFELIYKRVLLSPGDYRCSVAIWDKNEALAFDYHNGCYKFKISGNNKNSELLYMPFEFSPKNFIHKLLTFSKAKVPSIDLSILNDKWGEKIETGELKLASVKLLNSKGKEESAFLTNEAVKVIINFNDTVPFYKNHHLWLGIYRDDGICCQNIISRLWKGKAFQASFSGLPLLPGGYRISVGIWDNSVKEFPVCHHGIHKFSMISDHKDHGTVYLEHNWEWSLPK